MTSNDLQKQLEELKKFKEITEKVSYEDEVLEDTDAIVDKRKKRLESNQEKWIEHKHQLLRKAKKENNLDKIFAINTLFPYESMRNEQEDLIEDIYRAVNKKEHILAHAPTGLGKTIASLGPTIEYALRAKKVVFFLTSRQTQHAMAINTIKDIEQSYGIKLDVLDIIGKKSMCLQLGLQGLSGADFTHFCKTAKKERSCEYYNNTKKSNGMLKLPAEIFVDELKGTFHTEELISLSEEKRMCPYEVALSKGETAQIVISDYSYIFHPHIREIFFKKIGVTLEDCLIVVDEAHNLPDRTKSLASSRLTFSMMSRAIKEAIKFECNEAKIILQHIDEKMREITIETARKIGDEMLVSKNMINQIFTAKLNFDAACKVLTNAVDLIRKEQKRSSIFAVLTFIVEWQGEEEGFVRIFSKQSNEWTLTYSCLDPSIITKSVFDTCESSVIISGTLEPPFMYKDILGIPQAITKMYKNPFPEDNALHMIIPKTTTQYARRSAKEYENIANECKKLLKIMPGNTAIFFPSYSIRNQVYKYLYDMDEEFILEEPRLTKDEKAHILSSFTKESLKRRILLGTSSGSFGEGIDLPGNFLTGVIIVGLPLLKPTLEVEKLIEYYNKKYGKGWDYGYFYPSFNKTFQNAGRCIRSETDKGIICYLDERFAEKRYLKYFGTRPYNISENYEKEIKEF